MSGARPPARSPEALGDVAELFARLVRRGFEGTLALSRGRERKRIVWQRGAPVLADSNTASESLLTRLRQAGRIGPGDAARVGEHLRRRGGREEAALLALELLSPEEVVEWLRRLLRERLLEVFSWSGGEYAIDPSARAGEDAAALRCDPLPLLQEGLAVHRPPGRLREWLIGRGGRFVCGAAGTGPAVARLHADPELTGFVESLDGSRRLAELVEEMRSPVALAGVWVLEALGALRHRSSASRRDPAPLDADQIEIVVGEEPANAPARVTAPSPAARGGDAKSAATDAERLRQEIRTLHASREERTHYEWLGVPTDANPAQIKRAYLMAAKRFHPDALARLGLLELREEARVVFSQIARAHGVLSDPRRRGDYDETLRGDGESLDAARIVQAEMLYRKGEILLRSGNFGGALEFLEPAAELMPDEPAYALALGWALFRKRPPDLERARAACERAVKLDDRAALAHHRLGLVLRAAGDEEAAERALETARRLDPKLGRA